MTFVEYAHDQGLKASGELSKKEQKTLGQFMTPLNTARFMAQRSLPSVDQEVVRILDPSSGTGILAASVVEALLLRDTLPKKIMITLFEIDPRLIPLLRKLADQMRKEAKKCGVILSVSIRHEDFLLSAEALSGRPLADIVIANPPYFKLNARDPRALAHPYAVYGQPNIYGIFMAACSNLLYPQGRWCFITPRSWTNGMYFTATRRHLLRHLYIDAMHLFESRKDHFTDEILQEAMIVWATAQSIPRTDIVVSSSEGSSDLADSRLIRLPLEKIISQDGVQAISLPTNVTDQDLSLMPDTLGSYGLKVSTGPVVAFRAKKHLSEKPLSSTVPLLWMQHISRMNVNWPINKKLEHIRANPTTAWMLVPNTNLVIMRRFSPKEDERRVTAAPYIGGKLPGAMIGLENHTNYIYRPGGKMTAIEAKGVAAYLNSKVVDTYLRSVAGNTQVNAADLRKLPFPAHETILMMGNAIRPRMSLVMIDDIVDEILGITQGNNSVGIIRE